MSDIGNIPATSEITPERVYLQRREFIKSSLLFAATSSGVGSTLLWLMRGLRAKDHEKTTTAAATGASGDDTALTVARHFDYAPGEKNTSFNGVTNYNNFYEFGTDKSDPAANAYTPEDRVPGRWRSMARWRTRKFSRLTSSSNRSPSRNASTGCVASKPGRWLSHGWVSR